MTCYVSSGDTVSASTTVTATLSGVANPPAGSPTLAVSTSSDNTPATSPPYTVGPAQPVSGVGVTITPPTSAAGGLTTYGVSFDTSSTGALDGDSGSTVTIALPANTGLDSFYDGYTSTLDAGGSQIGYCDATDDSASTPTVTCYVSSGDTVSASTPVTATLSGVTNPPAGSPTLAVSTSSDVTPVTSPSYTVTAARSVSQPAVSLSDQIEGDTSTDQITFKTSSTGALDGNAGSSVTVALPATTGLGSFNSGGGSSLDVGATQVGDCEVTDGSTTTPTVTCSLYSGETVGASTTVTATLTGVTNPDAGYNTLSVSTSSDTTPVSSASYDIEAQVAATYSCAVPGMATTSFPAVVSASTAPPSSIDEGGTFLTTLGSRITVPASVVNHFRGLGGHLGHHQLADDEREWPHLGRGTERAVSPHTESTSATNLPLSDTLAAKYRLHLQHGLHPGDLAVRPRVRGGRLRPGGHHRGGHLRGQRHPDDGVDHLHPAKRRGRPRFDHRQSCSGHAHLPGSGHPTPAEPGERRNRRRMGHHHRQHLDGQRHRPVGHGDPERWWGRPHLRPVGHERLGDQLLLLGIRKDHLLARDPGRSGHRYPRRAGQHHRPGPGHHHLRLGHHPLVQRREPVRVFGPLGIVVVQGGNGTTAVAAPGISLASTKAPLTTAKASVSLTLPTTKIKKASRAEQLAFEASSAGTTLVTPPPVAVTLESLAASKEPALCPPTGSLKCEGNIIQAVGNFAAYTNKQVPIVAVLKFFYGLRVPAGTVYMLKSNGKSVVKLPTCVKSTKGYNTPCVSGKEVTGGAAAHDSLYAQDTVYFTGTDPAMGRR